MSPQLARLLLAVPCALAAGALAPSGFAQVATDGTVGPRLELSGPDYAIGAELGSRAGDNLFHSFERFSLATGERATLSGPGDIRNVISRVTGGARSDIDGALRSTIPGADFSRRRDVRAERQPGRPGLVPRQHGRRAALLRWHHLQRDQSRCQLAHGRGARGVRVPGRRARADRRRRQPPPVGVLAARAA